MNNNDIFQIVEIPPLSAEEAELVRISKEINDKELFSKQQEASDTARKILGPPGAMVWYSKSDYRRKFPEHTVVFNSNLCTETGKIWYGDLDCTKRVKKLKELALTLKQTVYVLREMDGRFQTETKPLIERAVFSTDGNTCTVNE